MRDGAMLFSSDGQQGDSAAASDPETPSVVAQHDDKQLVLW